MIVTVRDSVLKKNIFQIYRFNPSGAGILNFTFDEVAATLPHSASTQDSLT